MAELSRDVNDVLATLVNEAKSLHIPSISELDLAISKHEDALAILKAVRSTLGGSPGSGQFVETPIETVFSVRARKAIKRAWAFHHFGDWRIKDDRCPNDFLVRHALQVSAYDLRMTKHCGPATINEIVAKLKDYGLRLLASPND